MKDSPRLGFLASGRGSNMQSIIDACESGQLSATPVIVISNNQDSEALQRGQRHGLASLYLSSVTHPDPDELDQALCESLQSNKIDLLILAGYMKRIGPALLSAYKNRIINIHPSLLPKHGGQGMFGIHVHEAVLAAGDTETGVTIHLVDEDYDRGRILAQQKVPVQPGDDASTLATRVLEVEHHLYVETIGRILSGEIQLRD